MDDHAFCWDGPAQMIGEDTGEILRRAEAKVDEAAAQLERATYDLPLLLSIPITRDRVTNWLDEQPGDRRAAFGNTLWGTIRWDRSLGQPTTTRLADAFTFHHERLEIEGIATGGVPIVNAVWEPLPEPRAWDGPHDEDNYRVSVLVRAYPGLLNRFWPALRPDVKWEPKTPAWSSANRRMTWPESMIPYGDFFLFSDDILVLEGEYQVVKYF